MPWKSMRRKCDEKTKKPNLSVHLFSTDNKQTNVLYSQFDEKIAVKKPDNHINQFTAWLNMFSVLIQR